MLLAVIKLATAVLTLIGSILVYKTKLLEKRKARACQRGPRRS